MYVSMPLGFFSGDGEGDDSLSEMNLTLIMYDVLQVAAASVGRLVSSWRGRSTVEKRGVVAGRDGGKERGVVAGGFRVTSTRGTRNDDGRAHAVDVVYKKTF